MVGTESGVYSNKSSNCVVEGCTFDKNTGGGAGAVRLGGTFTITDCVLTAMKLTLIPEVGSMEA